MAKTIRPTVRPRFKAQTLPPEVQAELARLLAEGYTYAAIHTHLQGLGADISRAAVGRWAKHWLGKKADLETLAHLAKSYTRTQQDSPLGLGDMAAGLALDLICRCLLEHPDIVAGDSEAGGGDLSISEVGALVQAIGRLQGSSLVREKWQTEIHERARKTADDVARAASREGLSDETIDLIKRQILGIAEVTP